MAKLRVGILGAGKMALWHCRAYSRLPQVEIVALANSGGEAGPRLARKFGIARYYTDYRKLLESEKLDAVDICTPTGNHREMILAAFERRLSVYTEKPVGKTVAEIDEILRHPNYKNTILFNGYNLRLCPEFVKIGEILKSGTLGEVRFLHFSRTTHESTSSYMFQPEKNGGILTEFSTHFFDLLDAWGFASPRSVQAMGSNVRRLSSQIDTVQAQLNFASGATATIFTSLAMPGIAPEITIVGTQRILQLRYGKIFLETLPTKPSIAHSLLSSTRKSLTTPVRILYNPFAASCSHFVNCLKTNSPSPYDAVVARRSVVIAETAARNIANPDEDVRSSRPTLVSSTRESQRAPVKRK